MNEPLMDGRIYTSEMPPYHLKKLVYWAFADRKTKTTLAKDILVARTEVNDELIDRKLADYALNYLFTTEQLKELILLADSKGISNAQLHNTLKEYAGKFEAVRNAIAAPKKAPRKSSDLDE